MSKVSVIVPIYGVEQYIERCARSLFEQSLDDIEYIFINDCTQDNSMSVLECVMSEYPFRQSQVRIVSMDKNSGQAAARKKGIELATGEYIIHCDSDDFVDMDMYRILYETAKKSDYDIVYCDYFEGRDDNWKYNSGKLNNDSDLIQDILMMPMGGSLCNKMVRASIVKDNSIVFPSCNLAEDLALTTQYAVRSLKNYFVHKALYYYYVRKSSISRNHSLESVVDNIRQHVLNFDIALSALQNAGKEKRYNAEIIHHKLGVKNNLLQLVPPKSNMIYWKNVYPDLFFPVLLCKYVTVREKCLFLISEFNLYSLFVRVVKK